MDATLWQDRLIALYCFLSREYQTHLWTHVQRQSNHAVPPFSDEEVLAVYLFGLLQPLPTAKAIHRFTASHLRAWFPLLPSYSGFSARLNALSGLLPPLAEAVLKALPAPHPSTTHLLDSMPIQLAKGVRARQARVAAEVADTGYCASKHTYYYGVKLHVLALHAPHTLPRLEQAWVSPASASDLTVARSHTPDLPPGEIYADKIYQDHAWQAELLAQQQAVLRTPVRRVRNQEPLDAADRLYGSAASRVRQPVEVFFSWLQRHTGIENASRVRSTAGLWVHVFGRITAALLLLLLNS